MQAGARGSTREQHVQRATGTACARKRAQVRQGGRAYPGLQDKPHARLAAWTHARMGTLWAWARMGTVNTGLKHGATGSHARMGARPRCAHAWQIRSKVSRQAHRTAHRWSHTSFWILGMSPGVARRKTTGRSAGGGRAAAPLAPAIARSGSRCRSLSEARYRRGAMDAADGPNGEVGE